MTAAVSPDSVQTPGAGPAGLHGARASAAARRARPAARTLDIAEVAARTGLTLRALRYYETLGLVPSPRRTPGRPRRYSERDVARLKRIVRLKRTLGLSLAEIRRLMAADELLRAHARRTARRPVGAAGADAIARAEGLVNERWRRISSGLRALEGRRAELEAQLEWLRARLRPRG